MTTVTPTAIEGDSLSSFRADLRRFLRDHTPPAPHAGSAIAADITPADVARQRAWQRQLHDGGWAGVAWPKSHGGRGAGASQQLAFHEEIALAGGDTMAGLFLVALSHAGPTIIARGTPEQQRRWLPGILRGEIIAAQCFSEPGAGSDLAAIATRAVVDGDALVVTGEKRWSTFAQHADIAELLVRTDPSSRHGGLTYAIVDLDSPGITIRPLRTIGGPSEFCEVRFDEVRVPLANVIGAVGEGWQVATTTLLFERSTITAPMVLGALHALRRLSPLVADDPLAAAEVAALAVRALAVRALLEQSVAEQEAGIEGAGPSALKLLATELNYEVRYLHARHDQSASQPWFTSFGLRIGGGTSEIQQTIIAERVLGLPRHR